MVKINDESLYGKCRMLGKGERINWGILQDVKMQHHLERIDKDEITRRMWMHKVQKDNPLKNVRTVL